MASDLNAALINAAAIQEMLSFPRPYGPNGFNSLLDGGPDRPPPADVVAVLEQLETAAVDPALLTGSQTVASVEAQTLDDLSKITSFTYDQLGDATGPYHIGAASTLRSLLYPQDVAALKADAKLFTPGSAPSVTVIDPPPPPASGVEQYLVTNITTGVSDWENGQAYNGPVATLQNQFIDITADNVNVTATKPNNFIHTGAGNDAIDLSLFEGAGSGTNVVDGGGGSNYVVASIFGNSIDTFLIDQRAATADTWTTVANFHLGDAVTIYGVTPSTVALDWEDNQGAAGSTGLTLHAIAAGKPIASLTLANGHFTYSKADLSSGRLAVSFGTDPVSGSSYLYIHSTTF